MCLVSILKTYEGASRQKINLDKLELSCSWNAPSTRIDELTMLLGEKAVETYVKYLGLPTLIAKSET